MDSTDEDQLRRDRGIDEKPRLQELLTEEPRVRFYPQVRDDVARREALRDAELKRMEELYARIEKGIDEGMVDLESGAKMLLNVSAARMALGGVGHVYPGAF